LRKLLYFIANFIESRTIRWYVERLVKVFKCYSRYYRLFGMIFMLLQGIFLQSIY